MNKFSYPFILLFFTSLVSLAQGVRGKITTDTGEPLSFATIYVRSIETGSASNIDGNYEIPLKPGKYDLVYQYLGYETVVSFVEVKDTYVTKNVVLKPQTIVLRDVTIRAGKEDPAYTIMRKAIAKAKYHQNQLDEYTARVYMKGSGRLKDSPLLLRKMIEKEGIDSTKAFVMESVTDVKYTRPNTFEENVISIRTSGEDNNTSPMQYISGSFYDPKVVDAISPLSPKAFSYYKFRYDGSFVDRGYTISKIRVIPRVGGDNLFKGDLFIVEDYWSIYSLDFLVYVYGIGINVEQICEPIEEKVWMPVTHKFNVDGTFLGFDFEYNYLATVSNYQITVNPDLDMELQVVDDKVEKELAKEIQLDIKKSKNEEALEKLMSGEEVTRKDLRKIMREYEKQEMKEEFETPDIMENRTLNYDSSAYKHDSTYWAQIRPVPLSDYEVKGYQFTDSLAVVEKNESEGDTIKVKEDKKFLGDSKFIKESANIIFGHTYKVGDKAHLQILPILERSNFNTVEGYNFEYGLAFTKTFNNLTWLKIEPIARYSFSRNTVTGKGMMQYRFGGKEKKKQVTLTMIGGKYTSQLNRDFEMIPISDYTAESGMFPLMNTFTTLFLEGNYMKVYEKDFAEIRLNKQLSDKVYLKTSLEWEDRIPLSNNTDHTWIDWKTRNYSSNNPNHISGVNTAFQRHRSSTLNVEFTLRPWLKYRIRNGEKREIDGSSPVIKGRIRTALEMLESELKYTFIGAEISDNMDVRSRGKFYYYLGLGGFIDNDSLSFIDYKHFNGNLSPFTKSNPNIEYRIMDYYNYSSDEYYLSGLFNYQFGRLFVSQIPWVNKQGIRENVFVNYLGTESLNSYVEIGYGLNYIYRVFKVEGVAAFENGKYKDWGVRIGIATGLDDLFNFD